MEIKETLEVVLFLENMAEAIDKAKADGKVDWQDLLNKETRELVPSLFAAIKDSEQVKAEIQDLTKEETSELVERLVFVAFKLAKNFM
jgi:hypothetical protein